MPPDSLPSPVPADAIAPALLSWYDRHRRALPWRALPAQRPDPYHVWLSEVMLQQTTVATVADYFRRFVDIWPRIEDLAAAPLDDVLSRWAGLGYYARARNLHRCAQTVVAQYGGRFPQAEVDLRALPGIGQYTAAAIAAIAFDQPATVVDGNVERVVSRLIDLRVALPAAKAAIHRAAAALTPTERPGDYAQAMMDLGATLCVPRSPKCVLCPIQHHCQGRIAGSAAALPLKAPKRERPTRRAIAFWLTDPSGAVFLRRRPEKGLLGGMMEVPSSPWEAQEMPALTDVLAHAPVEAFWRTLPDTAQHTFTHFHLELAVVHARISADQADALRDPPAQEFFAMDQLDRIALPTAMAKIVRLVLRTAGKAPATRRTP